MEISIVLLLGILAGCTAQRAKPPQMLVVFPKEMYFSHDLDVQTLECKAIGIPDVSYEWRKTGAVIHDGQDDFKIEGGKLTLAGPHLRDEGYYQCFAENRYGRAMSSVAHILKAVLLGYTSMYIADRRFDPGQHGVLTCRSPPNSIPSALYDWYIIKSQTVNYNKRVVVDQLGDLHFINIEEGDELKAAPGKDRIYYNCSLYNALTSSRVYGSPTKLTVNPGYPLPRDPSIFFHTLADDAIAYIGQSVILQCIPDGYPLPTVEWSKQGGSLPIDRHFIDEIRYTLRLVNITENDEAEYNCTAVQGNQRKSQSIFVDVKSAPIWVRKLKSQTITEGQTVKFGCVARSAVGEIDNVIIRWFKNGTPLSSSSGKIMISGASLQVNNIRKPDDLMSIQCNVSNSVGYQIADAFLNVLQPTVLNTAPEPRVSIEPGTVKRINIKATVDPLYVHQVTYNWTHNGKPIFGSKTDGDPVYKDFDNSLVINATSFINTATDNDVFLNILGTYTCLVSLGLEDGTGDVFTHSFVHYDEAGHTDTPCLWEPPYCTGFAVPVGIRVTWFVAAASVVVALFSQ